MKYLTKILAYAIAGGGTAILFTKMHIVVSDIYSAISFGLITVAIANIIEQLAGVLKKSKKGFNQ